MDLKQELYDVCGMWHTPFWQTKIFFWALITFFLVAGCFILWYMLFRKKTKMIVKTAWDQALDEVRELQKRNIASVGHGKEFYHALTALMKKYLQNRFGFKIADKTDDELVRYLLSVDFPPDLIEQLRSIFNGGVYVKFANVCAVQEQIEQAIVASISLIKATTPTDNNKKD
jgi:hypothetical protein